MAQQKHTGHGRPTGPVREQGAERAAADDPTPHTPVDPARRTAADDPARGVPHGPAQAGHGPGHSGDGRSGGRGAWRAAAQATLHCLTGCAIGEVLGMVVGTALAWGNWPTTLLAIVLAFFFGYLLTLRGVLASGAGLRVAVRVALAADTVSIAVMELVDNGTIAVWPAAMDASLADALFWLSLGVSLVVAFVITTPVNHWMIGRGKGHAVAHRYHH